MFNEDPLFFIVADMFSEQSKIIPAKEGQPNGSGTGQPPRENNGAGTGQPPREYRSEVLDAFKKAPSPSGATVGHL